MSARPRHPNKEIERAVAYAEEKGWRVVMTNGHGWARLLCPAATRSGCQISVWSTPKNPSGHALAVKRLIGKCDCAEQGD